MRISTRLTPMGYPAGVLMGLWLYYNTTADITMDEL
jgi:hypothetical protein